MKYVVHRPEPVPITVDLLGISLPDLALLRRRTGSAYASPDNNNLYRYLCEAEAAAQLVSKTETK